MRIPHRGDYKYYDNVSKDQELVRLRNRIAEYESGEAYSAQEKKYKEQAERHRRELEKRDREHAAEIRERDREIRKLRKICSELTETV